MLNKIVLLFGASVWICRFVVSGRPTGSRRRRRWVLSFGMRNDSIGSNGRCDGSGGPTCLLRPPPQRRRPRVNLCLGLCPPPPILRRRHFRPSDPPSYLPPLQSGSWPYNWSYTPHGQNITNKWLYVWSYTHVCYNYITTPDSPHELICYIQKTKPRFCCILMPNYSDV